MINEIKNKIFRIILVGSSYDLLVTIEAPENTSVRLARAEVEANISHFFLSFPVL